MGSCQSKKDTREPKQLPKRSNNYLEDETNQSPIKKPSTHTPTPVRDADDHGSNKKIHEFLSPSSQKYSEDHLNLLNACFREIQDIAGIQGLKVQFLLGQGDTVRVISDSVVWNPLLLAIASKQVDIVRMIFERVPNFHKINCLSKPYTKEKQKGKVFGHWKRIKRECFALKMAIMNHDEEMFKFLWNDNRLLWNLGHFIECLEKIFLSNWDQGLKLLMASTTSKVIFMSINTVQDFIDSIDLLKYEVQLNETVNARLTKKFKSYLFSRPYFLFSIFLEIASYTDKPNREFLASCLQKLKHDDIQLKHKELNEVFEILDDSNYLSSFKERLMNKFEDKDADIERYHKGLARLFEKETSIDSEENIGILEELDLFAFREIMINGKPSNPFIGSLQRGFMKLVDYTFGKGYGNVRSLIRQNNCLEVQNDIAQVRVDYFLPHIRNVENFIQIYHELVDFLQLSNFLEIFDLILDGENWHVFTFILSEPKFMSLFYSSLELQKYLFITELKDMVKNQAEIIDILTQDPYLPYYKDVKRGNEGNEYTQKTIAFLESQEEQKQQIIAKRKTSMLKSRGSGLIQFKKIAGIVQAHINSTQKEGVNQDSKRINLGLAKITEEGENLQQTTQTHRKSGTNGMVVIDESELIKKETKSKQGKRGSKNGKDGKKHRKRGKKADEETAQNETNDLRKIIHNNDHVDEDREFNLIQEIEEEIKEEPKLGFKNNRRKFKEDDDSEPDFMMQNSRQSNVVQLPSIRGKIQNLATFEDDIGSADASDTENMLSQRIPNVLEKKSRGFSEYPIQESQRDQDMYLQLPSLVIDCIKTNNIQKLKYLLSKFNIKNVAWLKQFESKDKIQMRGKDFDVFSNQSSPDSRKLSRSRKEPPIYDTSQWNPVLYAIYYQKVEILKLLLEQFVVNFIMAIRLPPQNEFTEYIIPGQRPQFDQWSHKGKGMNFKDESDASFHMSPDNKSQPAIPYNPTDARVECFGLELAIRNRDIETLKYLWNDQYHRWEEKHFAFVLDKVLQEHWDVGIGCIFRSKTSKAIFKGLNPEDKDNFLFSKIIDKITSNEYWERDKIFGADSEHKSTYVTEKQVEFVVQELQYKPYGNYTCMKYPQLFEKYDVLDQAVSRVTKDDIYDFVVARKENVRHLSDFLNYYEQSPNLNRKTLDRFRAILKQASVLETQQRRIPSDPKQIVQLIKLGDVNKLKEYFEKDDNSLLLKLLNQLQGHSDPDYQKLYQQSVKYIPSDETIQILLADNSTVEWNPFIFAIFYQKIEIVRYFCENRKVFVRNCLTTPFIIEVDEDAEDLDEEKFVKEKTEIFCLVMCIMLQNREIFKYLWRRCAYMWNDIHLVALTNFIFESQWLPGIRVLFESANTRQIFNAMNMYEKEKYLKFCDKSISKLNPGAIKDFRYQMSAEPYNIYYLPILATREDLQAWDKEDASKEIFIKNCQITFNERSFAMLSKLNTHYLSEFVSTAEEYGGSEEVQKFAKKLRRYMSKQIYKQEKQKQQEVDIDPNELEKEIAKQNKKPSFSAFQMMSDSEEEDNDEDETHDTEKQGQQQQDSEKKKKKKKKNKKKKKAADAGQPGSEDQQQQQKPSKDTKSTKQQKPKKDNDLEFLDSIISKQKEEVKQMYGISNYQMDSVIKMDRKFFNYKKELKQLFAKSAQAYGALGLDEEEKEERKRRGGIGAQDYEGASKREKRRLQMVEKMQAKNRVSTVKKYLLVQPNPMWPKVPKILSMEHIRTDKQTGQKIFSYVKEPEYKSLQKEFEAVQATADISNLMHFLQRNFYHHESLVYFADFLRIQGKFSDSFHFLERCLFAFESAWTFEFQPVPPEKAHDEFFVPQVRLDLDQEHLNKVFAECLVKYIDILGRKGCSRTSLEYCKFLLSLNPYVDLYGALLRVDFYALRAHEYQYIIDFVRRLPKELYQDESNASLLILPNLLMTTALAKFHHESDKQKGDYKVRNLDRTLEELMNLEQNINGMLELDAEALVISAIMLYPQMIELLMRKVAQKQINQSLKKSHFSGYQTKTWTETLAHPLFSEIGDDLAGQHAYNWVLSQDEQNNLSEDKQNELRVETLQKVYQIFVSRSSTLFGPDNIIMWLKEVIGYVLNKLEDGSLDRDLFIAKFTSLVQSPFALSRYRTLKQSDFTDDITTINPQELLGGPQQNQMDQQNVQAEAGIAAQQLQQMINQLNQPQPLQQMMQQQHIQQNPLIQDRDFQNMTEDELIAMQEAILEQMGDNEDIYIDEDEEGGGQNQGGGMMNYFNNMFGLGGGNNNQQNNNEEEKKQ